MRRLLGITFIAIAAVSQTGCGTILNFWSPGGQGNREDFGQTRIYGGVAIDARTLSEADGPWAKVWTIIVLLIEFPLSLVLDTATLPVTIPVTLSR